MNKVSVKSFIIAGAFMLFGAAQAYAFPQPRNLEAGMKMMQSRLKTISRQANIASKNSESAVLADEFTQITQLTKTFIPGGLRHLPPEEQAIRKDLYESMMDDASALGEKLTEAFQANDNVKAVEILNRLLKAKKEGHNEFKD